MKYRFFEQEQQQSVIEHRKRFLAKQQASSQVKQKYMAKAVSKFTNCLHIKMRTFDLLVAQKENRVV